MSVNYPQTKKWYAERLIVALEALQRISLIPDKTEGGDWDEIEEAREIAQSVLKESR